MRTTDVIDRDHATALGGAEVGLPVCLAALDRERFAPVVGNTVRASFYAALSATVTRRIEAVLSALPEGSTGSLPVAACSSRRETVN